MGDPSEPSSGRKNSTALSPPQIPARLASPTDMSSFTMHPTASPIAEPGARLSHVLMCRQGNLTIANLLLAAHLNIGA